MGGAADTIPTAIGTSEVTCNVTSSGIVSTPFQTYPTTSRTHNNSNDGLAANRAAWSLYCNLHTTGKFVEPYAQVSLHLGRRRERTYTSPLQHPQQPAAPLCIQLRLSHPGLSTWLYNPHSHTHCQVHPFPSATNRLPTRISSRHAHRTQSCSCQHQIHR